MAIALRDEMLDTKIVVMDLMPVHEEIMEFVNAGVSGFVLKDATFDEFVDTTDPSRRERRCCRPA